uniref:Putative vacuolar protein n=1 Tax=Xenopsylla cheopis TaxID=163159 RepID=A0A6M2DMP8_XENCH
MYAPDFSIDSEVYSNLESDELKEIIQDDEKFEELFKELPQVKNWDAQKESMMENNKSLAETNLLRNPDLAEKKEKLQELSNEGKQLCSSVQEMLNEIREKSGSISLDTALALLQTAAAKSEEDSENIAEQFISKEIDIDAFLEQFAASRKVMHLRKVKADKMKELITQRNSNSTNSYMPNVNNVPVYPVGPINMPMPGFRNNYF